MTGIEQIIVGMWFLPVTLFIIVPMVLFVIWHLGLGWAYRNNLLSRLKRTQKKETEHHVLSTSSN